MYKNLWFELVLFWDKKRGSKDNVPLFKFRSQVFMLISERIPFCPFFPWYPLHRDEQLVFPVLAEDYYSSYNMEKMYKVD